MLDVGPCGGPLYVLTTLVSALFTGFLPRPIGLPLRAGWWPLARLVRLGDRWRVRHPRAFVMASTTYVLARNPAA